MTVRAHAALWIAAVALAWILVGGDAAAETGRAAGSDSIRRVLEALVDGHARRIEANVLRTGLALGRCLGLAPVWAPVMLAGCVDGLAWRRARRCGLAAAPERSMELGRHALVGLMFAPVLAASLGASLTSPSVAAWAIALSAALAFTLSRVQGLGLRG